MRKLSLVLILAVLPFASLGCRTDKASQRSSTLDSSNGAPAAEASQPSPEPTQPVTGAVTPAANSTANASTVPDHRPLVVCFGDSLTAGYGTDPGESYPDYLQADLDAKGYKYRVVNLGVSGNTTKDGVERLPSVLALHPSVVIVEFGGNDGLRGLPISDSRANLDKIVATLKSSRTASAATQSGTTPNEIKVVLAGITLPPDYGPDYIQQFTDTYTLLAKKYRVPLLPFLLQNVYGVPGMMQHDRTHATAQGNKIVATNILPYVTPLLKK